jgi:hypothetical protein
MDNAENDMPIGHLLHKLPFLFFSIIPEHTDEYVSSWHRFENSAMVNTGH